MATLWKMFSFGASVPCSLCGDSGAQRLFVFTHVVHKIAFSSVGVVDSAFLAWVSAILNIIT